MPALLHKSYTLQQAIAAFESSDLPESYCDGQFFVFPNAVACFVVLGMSDHQSHVSEPSTIIWKPKRLDYAPDDDLPWLPRAIREVWDRSQRPIRKIKDHHMFLCLPNDEHYFYSGTAHLGRYDAPVVDRVNLNPDARFSLDVRLPRDIWRRLGGYSGWLVEINHESHHLEIDDILSFRRLAADLLRQDFSHLTLTRYEEDFLHLHTNDRRGWLMYLREPSDSGLYTRDQEYVGDPNREEAFQCCCGISLEFPASQTLPREMAIRVAEDFFASGQLPNSVQWNGG